MTRSATCTAGTFCPEMTQDEYEYVAQGGHFISGTSAAAWADQADCTDGNYCGQAASSETACPVGTQSLIGANQWDEAMCEPCDEGTACTSTGTTSGATPSTCTDGYFCPRGSSAATQVECYPGTKGNGGGAGSWQ